MPKDQFLLSLPTFDRPTVVLTGPPGSGKTTAADAMVRSVPGVRVLGESASVVKRQTRISPEELGNHATLRLFQRAVYGQQLLGENILAHRLRHPDARVGVIDRGLMDGAGYLPGGRNELVELTGVPWRLAMMRYTAVLFFAPAPKSVYDAVIADEALRGERFEPYEDALRLGELQRGLWREHPNLIEIDGPDWASKFQCAVDAVNKIATQPFTAS